MVDVVGGDAFTDSLRVLGTQGRLLVVGFAAGQGIPQVKVNRLLLNNIDIRGVGWGAYAMLRPGYMQQQWAALLPMMESGVIRPPIGKVYDFEDFGQALVDMDERRRSARASSASGTEPAPQAAHGQRAYAVRLDWGPTGAAAIASRRRPGRGRRRALLHHDAVGRRRPRAEVLPYRWRDASATAYAAERGATLAAGRFEGGPGSCQPVAGGDERAVVGRDQLVLPSPNGSTISAALADADLTVVAACLRNRARSPAGSRRDSRRVRSSRWSRPASAGPTAACGRPLRICGVPDAVIAALLDPDGGLSPEAAPRVRSPIGAARPTLADAPRGCASGQELIAAGFGDDVEVAGRVDVSDVVPVLADGAFSHRVELVDRRCRPRAAAPRTPKASATWGASCARRGRRRHARSRW